MRMTKWRPPKIKKGVYRANESQISPIGQITGSGYLDKKPSTVPTRQKRVFGKYALVYVYGGQGQYEDSNGHKAAVGPGDLITVFPEIGHRYGNDIEGWSEFYLVFNGPVFDLWREHGLLDPARPIRHLEPVSYWLGRFESVLGTSAGWSPPIVEVCRLQQVLADVVTSTQKNRQHDDWPLRACALLSADLSKKINLRTVAEELHMSYANFRRQFNLAIGMPPAHYRATRIIDRAGELMHQTQYTDKQIAHELGFYDEFYFSKRFKQITGMSPRQFRKSLP